MAGTPPDIAQLLLREWDQNIESLPVKTLSEIVPADELQAALGGTYPIHPKALKLTERNGKLQGLPYVFSTPTLFYNATLFKAAGLDPDAPPTTWAQVRTAAQTIKQTTGNDGLAILCGHSHVSTAALFAGTLHIAAPATAYLLDPSMRAGGRGLEGAAFNLCTVREQRLVVNPVFLPSLGRELYRHLPAA